MPEWQAAEREAYLALALVPGVGAARLRTLLVHIVAARRIHGADPQSDEETQLR